MYFVNKSNITIEVDKESLIKELLSNPDFRKATDEEITIYRKAFMEVISTEVKKPDEKKDDNKEGCGVYFSSTAESPDGYGQSSGILLESLIGAGLNISKDYQNQPVTLLYSYPYFLKEIKSPVKVIYTMFESTSIPNEWVSYLNLADKVLVPSKFCQEAFLARGIKTEVVPLGYDDSIFAYKEKEDNKIFTFLHYNAFNTRKGWDIVFNAFTKEFSTDEPVRLIFKTTRKDTPFPILKSQYPNIDVIKENYAKPKLVKLLQESDCFVFPSRGEGFGLTPLEALATGTPTIVPNASGMSEYFNSEYFHEVRVSGKTPALYQNFISTDTGEMIETDENDLRKQMRYVFEHKKEAYEKAKRGALWVKEEYPISKTGKVLAKHLEKYSKEAIVQKTKADVNLVTLLWASNGMGRVGEEVLLALDRMGIKVKILPDYLEKEGLQERTLELLDISDSYTKADITLYYAVPKILPRDLSSKNFLHIDWDTTKAPKEWVDKINQYINKVYPSSEFVKDVFNKSGINRSMTVIRHGVRSDRFPFIERKKKKEFVFLTCGDISLRKGTDVLIEAFTRTFPNNENVKLIIKSNQTLEWGKIEKPTDKRITIITERYEHDDFIKLYEKADCYVAPSRAEGFCLPAVEAMSTGLPLIIHDWSGMASIANDKYNYPIGSSESISANSKFYPPEYQEGGGIGNWKNPNKEELANKMKYVYENRELAMETGKKASKWVKDEWGWDNQVRKMWMDMAESCIPSLPDKESKEKEWGEFYKTSKITKEGVLASCNAHKELFWILKGFYPNKVIEAGCGPATMSAFLSNRVMEIEGTGVNTHEFKEIVAMDNDSRVLDVARDNLKQFGDVRLLNDNAFTCSEKADVVFAQGMLEHLSNEQMRTLIANQLTQSQIVIHSIPNIDYKKLDFGNERLLSDEELYRIFDEFDLTIYRYWNEEGLKKMSILVFKNVKNPPKVSIIMPVWNQREMTISAIEAVRRNTKDYELIVIDNSSTDGVSEWLDKQMDIRVVHLSKNLGVPGAKNIGMMLAKGEYICFLDNDTVAGWAWLDNLLSVFKDETVGFTGTDGWLIDKDKKNFLGEQFNHDKVVDWAAHSIFVFPRRLLKETGMLIDRDLWCIEDVDQCCRIRSLGYKGKLPDKETNMVHLGGQTAKKMTGTLSKFAENSDKVWRAWGEFINTRGLYSKIDIGSGDNPKQGYVHVDIQKIHHVDIVSMADDLKLPDSSVGEIYSSHLVEHFTQEEFDIALKEWHRVLDNGGVLTIKCPDILTVCDKLLNKKVDYNLGVAWIYGGHRTKWDFHYWEYCFDSLKEKLEKNGFGNVEHLEDVDDWLKVKCICNKDNSQLRIDGDSTKVLFKGNHHHIFGGGENMTFGVIKMLNELYKDLEIDIDLSKVDTKKGFDIDVSTIPQKSDRKNDVFMCISHFSLPKPEGKKNVAVIFYPQYDWKEDIKKYDKVVAISKYSADAIKEKWGIDSVIIPPSIDTSKFKVAEKKKQIISVGRFFWQPGGNNKNQHILIKAFSQMPKGWKLVLVGSVQNTEYYDNIRRMAKGLDVEFVHEASFDELVKLYSESELFWSATGYGATVESSQEHFGMVAVEALASGCRTFVYRGGGMAEINGVETWSTIEELVKLSTKQGNKDIKELVEGVERYSNDSVKLKWRELIATL